MGRRGIGEEGSNGTERREWRGGMKKGKEGRSGKEKENLARAVISKSRHMPHT